MRLSPGVILVSYPSQQRLGWLPILLSVIDQAAKEPSRSELFQRCDTLVNPFVTQWLADEHLLDKSSGWNKAAVDSGLNWLRSLGLLTSEGYSLTSLGRVWLDVWFQVGSSSDNPLLLQNPIRRLVAWTTLLNADGLLLLSTVKALSSTPQSLKQLHLSLDNTLETNVWFTRVHSGGQHLKRLQTALPNLFHCRLKPLVELGVVRIAEMATYALTDLGEQIKATVSEWSLDDEDTLKTLPIECAWQLARLGTDRTELSSEHLASHLLQWIQLRGTRVWRLTAPMDAIPDSGGLQTSIPLSHWPLWESLLLAACESLYVTNSAFELVAARRVLDDLNQRHPGLIRWIEDRERKEQLFQIRPGAALDTIQSPPEHMPAEVAWKVLDPGNGDVRDLVSPNEQRYPHDDTVVPHLPTPESIFTESRTPGNQETLSPHREQAARPTLWLDLMEDELLSEERRPGRIPLLGAVSTLLHLERRLHSIHLDSESDQETRFWKRLDSGEEWASRIRSQQPKVWHEALFDESEFSSFGLYGSVLSRLTHTWSELKPVATLRKFLLQYRENKRERHSQALARIEHAMQELRSRQIFMEPEVESLRRAQLSVRDALIAGHVTRDWMATQITCVSSLPLESIAPGQQVLFEYSGSFSLPKTLFALLLSLNPNRCLRIQDTHDDWIEATIPSDAEKTRSLEPPQLPFSGSIKAVSRKIAQEQAESFVARLHGICLLGLTKATLLDNTDFSVKVCSVQEGIPKTDNAENSSNKTSLCWRTDFDSSLLRLAVEGVRHEALRRTLAAWRRSISASSVRSQFTELWSALEHLVGPTGGLGFTRHLAELITARMLKRRLTSLVEELVQRGLRCVATLPEQKDESASDLYTCIAQLCIANETTFRSEFPFDAQRSNPDARIRHEGLSLKLPLDFACSLTHVTSKLQVALLLKLTEQWLPSLHQCLVEWNEALSNRHKFFGLLIREHDHIVQTYGLIYDLRNRIQHEDEPFDGPDEPLLEVATDYLRTWWRVLVEGLLELRPEQNRPLPTYLHRLKHSLEDLALGFSDAKELKGPPSPPSAHELELLLGES